MNVIHNISSSLPELTLMKLDYCERCDLNFRYAIGALEDFPAFLVCGNNDVVVKQANEFS